MIRIACFVFVLVGSACAAPEPPVAPVAPVDPAPPPPADPLTGNLGAHPFSARAALLVQPNSLSTRCTTENGQRRCEENVPVSYIRILERQVTCAELVGPAERRDVPINPDERTVDVVLQAPWPVPSGTVLRTDATMSVPRRDHVTASFKDGAAGAVAVGSARFTTMGATTALTLDLETTNPALPTSGRVHGTVTLVACTADPTAR